MLVGFQSKMWEAVQKQLKSCIKSIQTTAADPTLGMAAVGSDKLTKRIWKNKAFAQIACRKLVKKPFL